jgi:hypothetical protein
MEAPILRIDRHSLPVPHGLPAAARVAFEITRGRVSERLRPIAGKVFLIGTANDCDLVLGDLTFPETYAYVFVSGTELTIRWLGGPELRVCGEAVTTAELFHGDLVEFGPFELRVVIQPGPRHRDDPDDETILSFPTLRETADRAGAIDEVRSLLLDIRRELFESTTSNMKAAG